MSLHANRVQMTVSGSPGTGPITLASATAGYQSFGSAYSNANATVDILIVEGNNWEVCRNCLYTHATPSVDRGTREASSAAGGGAVSFGSSAIVSVIATANFGNRAENAFQSLIPGGRLTLESGVPVPTTDQTAKTTIYYTPYQHNIITLWDGGQWVPTAFTETSLALGTLTSGANYDVFGFLSSDVLALEMLVWTNNTARATTVTLQDGRYCKSGDKTRLYLGTFRTTSTTQTEDSGFISTTAARKRFVWNAYNRVRRVVAIEEDTASWTYATTNTARQVRASADNQVEAICGLASEAQIDLDFNLTGGNNVLGGSCACGIGYDATNALASYSSSSYTASYNGTAGTPLFLHAHLSMHMELGYHYWAMLEAVFGAAATGTFYGSSSPSRKSVMVGWVEA